MPSGLCDPCGTTVLLSHVTPFACSVIATLPTLTRPQIPASKPGGSHQHNNMVVHSGIVARCEWLPHNMVRAMIVVLYRCMLHIEECCVDFFVSMFSFHPIVACLYAKREALMASYRTLQARVGRHPPATRVEDAPRLRLGIRCRWRTRRETAVIAPL